MAEHTTKTGQVTWLKAKYERHKPVKSNKGRSGGSSATKKPAKGKK
jgi:hypothetical protein